MDDLENKIISVANSTLPEEEKLQFFVNAMANLKPIDNSRALTLACNFGIESAKLLNRSEMAAQFYMTRAKTLLGNTGSMIHEMKQITLAPNWFQFSLVSEKERYAELDTKVNNEWASAQSDINDGFNSMRETMFSGPTAYCLKTAGEIYAIYYLQIRLYNFRSKSPIYARIANMYVSRWSGLDNYFLINSAGRKKLRQIKHDCLKMLSQSIDIFKKEGVPDYLADAYLAMAVEHESFVNPIRKKFYLVKAEALIRKHNIKDLFRNLELIKSRDAMAEARAMHENKTSG